LRFLDEIMKNLWRKWMAQVFQGPFLAQNWRKRHCNTQVGDVVLIKNETAAGVEFQRGKVMEAIRSKDGHIKLVEVEYKNPFEKVFRRMLRLIQKVVVIVLVDC
jgi:hypothetical protein